MYQRNRTDRRHVAQTRRHWRSVADKLDAMVAGNPEPGSVLDQLVQAHAFSDNTVRELQLVTTQGTQFLRASLHVVEPTARGVAISPVGPLARSALLAFSKIVAITAPLCWQVRGIGPALQYHHDGLIEMVIEQDRQARFAPASEEATIWGQQRPGLVNRIHDLRQVMGEKPLKNEPTSRDKLVTEGSWVAAAQGLCIALEALEGVPRDEFTYRMQWAWHRGSVVTHAGFGTQMTPAGLSVVYLGAEDASALIRCAVELAVAAQRTVAGAWFADMAPASFDYNPKTRLPRYAPAPQAGGEGPDPTDIVTDVAPVTN
jgi:hypothetical protein